LLSDIYPRLIVLTAGTLLPFFWIVVILGHRRQRNFERIFFFLCLSLVFFFGGSLLALNAELYYSGIPNRLKQFSWTLVCTGIWLLPSLLIHLHAEYGRVREVLRGRSQKWLWIGVAYVPAAVLTPRLYAVLPVRTGQEFILPGNAMGGVFQAWLVLALAVCAVWQRKFQAIAPDKEQRSFHKELKIDFGVLAWLVLATHVALWKWPEHRGTVESLSVYILLVTLAPLVALLRDVQKFNFLQIGRQRNLLYAVFAAFLALLYLSFIRRASLWLEPYFPPEATAALLLFLPVIFFESLQRLVGRLLRRTAQMEVDQANRTMGPILEVARLGSLAELISFVGRWVAEQLQLAEAELMLLGKPGIRKELQAGEESFEIRKSGEVIGLLRVRPYGAMLSGETAAALEFLCEQLPGALDLCRLIEEKLQLERELAERERLAVLGQMAASISHNLKNPLGSIKTILQVQMENPGLPESIRGETKMVLEEIGRLSSKLHQLLQFSRPAIRGGAIAATCEARAVADEVSAVLRHEAERRGLALSVEVEADGTKLAASSEAVSEILSNLVVNALEATPRGGHVKVNGCANGDGFLFAVEDDGPGIPESASDKILQPFFTTKTQGTGLGLAIVARRVAEFGGKLDWESPVKDGKGTRFEVLMPMKEEKK
jgi:signal transduction histidine kinase